MLDNTSRTRKTNARDAILNYEAIHEALDDLMRYPLPMATTLPLYGWDLIYKYYCPLNFKDSKNVWLER